MGGDWRRWGGVELGCLATGFTVTGTALGTRAIVNFAAKGQEQKCNSSTIGLQTNPNSAREMGVGVGPDIMLIYCMRIGDHYFLPILNTRERGVGQAFERCGTRGRTPSSPAQRRRGWRVSASLKPRAVSCSLVFKVEKKRIIGRMHISTCYQVPRFVHFCR